MPVTVERPDGRTSDADTQTNAAPALRCALVNNMPDAALTQTERQFLGLLRAGAGDRDVTVRRYALAGVPRSARSAAYLATEYFPVEELWDDEPQALVVTGSEPLAAALVDEPYWSDFAGLLDGALSRPTGVLLSCLAAHAGLLALDGLDRVRLPAKCFGVFAHEVAPGAALTTGMVDPVPMPHSRVNDIPTDAVGRAGWETVVSSPVGWGAITTRRGQAELLLVQGHPEYDADTLVREWRRDLGRSLGRGRPDVPPPPAGAVDADDEIAADALHRLLGDGRNPGDRSSAFDAFAFDAVGARAVATWRPAAEKLYANWFDAMATRLPAPGGVAGAAH